MQFSTFSVCMYSIITVELFKHAHACTPTLEILALCASGEVRAPQSLKAVQIPGRHKASQVKTLLQASQQRPKPRKSCLLGTNATQGQNGTVNWPMGRVAQLCYFNSTELFHTMTAPPQKKKSYQAPYHKDRICMQSSTAGYIGFLFAQHEVRINQHSTRIGTRNTRTAALCPYFNNLDNRDRNSVRQHGAHWLSPTQSHIDRGELFCSEGSG